MPLLVATLIAAGSATVGKSTLIKRYCESRFVQKYIPTIGIDYGVKPVRVLGHDLKVNFFDTSGADFDPPVNPQGPPSVAVSPEEATNSEKSARNFTPWGKPATLS